LMKLQVDGSSWDPLNLVSRTLLAYLETRAKYV
jgi:hypothetical protein